MGEHMHPEISMHTHPLGEYMLHIRAGNWKGVAELMISSAEKVCKMGAEIAICPDNTIHQAFEYASKNSPLPWLHIAEAVAEEALKNRFSKLAILGTKYLMVGPVYPKVLEKFDLSFEIPDEKDREQIDEIIFNELVNGIFNETSRLFFNQVIQRLKERNCDAAILGCTEIPLIVKPDDCPLPTLDSTRLLARAALSFALKHVS
jgi:aspartate racemase